MAGRLIVVVVYSSIRFGSGKAISDYNSTNNSTVSTWADYSTLLLGLLYMDQIINTPSRS